MLIPLKEVIMYNRLLWLSVSMLVFGFVFKMFSFSQNPITLSFRKSKGERTIKEILEELLRSIYPK